MDNYPVVKVIPDGLLQVPPRPSLLRVLKGCLCLSYHEETHFSFWLMRGFGVQNSWTHLLIISYDQLLDRSSLLDCFRFI
ncbi:hypothetical protein GLYMA_20G074800v4 [Glycine max]|uniref:F-box associated domain-containing protein n=2 Tax=Glycine subgen. Soja TaxID=1462606 RepID=A0A0R0E874_SOYBN|nr:hypothetical protein JHK86_055513 [Glycine max]KAG4909659.1 hypothetical protein JHK87_055775 [Glycine soja]KAG4918243.1 hypothetical protein JHK85_056524 [Glycine max]KAG5074322.1 hypothetical protein JHK84_055553 [Glycine max]KAH1035014.1 hypothetical protein GYH30_055131 [Glycine max]